MTNKIITICFFELILVWIEFYVGFKLVTCYSDLDEFWYMPPYILTCFFFIFLVAYITNKAYDFLTD